MRSIRGLAASAIILLTIPLTIIVAVGFGAKAETVIHFGMGIGFVVLAAAVFDFGLPRWVTLMGAAAAAAFGGIFLVQGVSELVHDEALTHFAFQVLGQQIERVLPEFVFAWFAALLLAGSAGRTRWIGWLVMPVVIGLEVAVVIGAVIGVVVPQITILFLLPIVWLLFESAKGVAPSSARAAIAGRDRLDAVAA